MRRTVTVFGKISSGISDTDISGKSDNDNDSDSWVSKYLSCQVILINCPVILT